jgi:hydrogenase expression/formation protein HypD
VKFVDEYRGQAEAERVAREIARIATRPHTLMEVCGGQTHAIIKYGIDTLLPDSIELIHGPGCPVCVTPVDRIDLALEVARRPEVILCSFGDMLRVPGNHGDLFAAKAAGADVRVVYSPLDAVALARKHPDREVVFFAVGFETTAPAHALAVFQADQEDIANFSILTALVRVPPAMEAILSSPKCRVQGFLAAGHVCTIMGCAEYGPLAEKYRVPIVVTGFEPLDILDGVLRCVRQLEAGEARVENAYARVVKSDGNASAQRLLETVFETGARDWRGLGTIPDSGLHLRARYGAYDAVKRFGLSSTGSQAETDCIAGDVLQGWKKPHECPAFGTRCTPESPLGAPMVSGEGACAAYYRYRRETVPGDRR